MHVPGALLSVFGNNQTKCTREYVWHTGDYNPCGWCIMTCRNQRCIYESMQCAWLMCSSIEWKLYGYHFLIRTHTHTAPCAYIVSCVCFVYLLLRTYWWFKTKNVISNCICRMYWLLQSVNVSTYRRIAVVIALSFTEIYFHFEFYWMLSCSIPCVPTYLYIYGKSIGKTQLHNLTTFHFIWIWNMNDVLITGHEISIIETKNRKWEFCRRSIHLNELQSNFDGDLY